MATLTYDPLEFQILSASTVPEGIAGEELSAGQPIYRKTTDRLWYLAYSDNTALEAQDIHLAAHGAAIGGPILPVYRGTVNYGAAAVGNVGRLYVLSGNPGALWEEGDLLASMYVTFAGVFLDGNLLGFAPYSSGQLRG